MESTSAEGRIHLSERAATILRTQARPTLSENRHESPYRLADIIAVWNWAPKVAVETTAEVDLNILAIIKHAWELLLSHSVPTPPQSLSLLR
jgi:hypothetical protein